MLSSSIAGSLNNQLFKLYTACKIIAFQVNLHGSYCNLSKRTEYLHSTVEAL